MSAAGTLRADAERLISEVVGVIGMTPRESVASQLIVEQESEDAIFFESRVDGLTDRIAIEKQVDTPAGALHLMQVPERDDEDPGEFECIGFLSTGGGPVIVMDFAGNTETMVSWSTQLDRIACFRSDEAFHQWRTSLRASTLIAPHWLP